MDFSVDYDVVADAVAWVAKTAPVNPAHPLLGGLKIVVEDTGVVSLFAYDYKVSAQETISADVTAPGVGLVPAHQFAQVVKSLPRKMVRVRVDGGQVLVSAGSSKFRLPLMLVDDYPMVPEPPAGFGVITGGVFGEVVRQVTVAAGTDEALPVLLGVCLTVNEDGSAVLAGTDRYRLAEKHFTVSGDVPVGGVKMVLPAKWLRDVGRVFTEAGDVSVGFRDGVVSFTCGSRVVTTVVIDGDYPNLSALFPVETPLWVVMKRDTIAAAVRRVSVAAGNNPVRFVFPGDGTVVVSAGVGDTVGEETQPVTQVAGVGDGFMVGYNQKYLDGGLQVVTGDYVKFSFTEASRPMVITGCDEDGVDVEGYRYLVMPVRLPQQQ